MKLLIAYVLVVFAYIGCEYQHNPVTPGNLGKHKPPIVQPPPGYVEPITSTEYYRCSGDWITASGTLTTKYVYGSGYQDQTIFKNVSGVGRSGKSYVLHNHFRAYTVFNASGWVQNASHRDTTFGEQLDLFSQDWVTTYSNGVSSSTGGILSPECP